MSKRYRGLCPPFIVIGLVLLFAVVSIIAGAVHALPVAHAVSNEGEDLPPPGGAWPPTSQIEGSTSTTQQGETTVTTPEHTDPPETSGTPEEGAPSTGIYVPVDPVVPDTPDPVETEEPVKEDPVGRYPQRLDTQGIKIVSPTLDELLAPGADLEALLYPSGLKLPTKYMDLLMFAPTNSSSMVVGETVNFLKTIAPNATGEYTFAEYEAADVYLAICRLYVAEEGSTKTGDALRNLDTNTTVNWMTNVTNATLGDYSRLVALISNYKELLTSYGDGATIGGHRQYRDLVANHKDVYYSMGDLSYYRSLADGSAPNDATLSTYTTNLYSTWSYLGVTHNITTNLLEYSYYFNEFALNGVNFNHGAPATSFTVSDPDAQQTPQGGLSQGQNSQGGGLSGGDTQVTSPNHGQTGEQGGNVISGSSDNEWARPNTQGSGDTPVSSVGSSTGVDSSVLPEGRQSLQDIASKVALGFVIIGVAVVWGIHTHRKGSDPLSKWK